MFKLFKSHKKLKKILFRILGYLLLNLLIALILISIFSVWEYEYNCTSTGRKLYFCAIGEVLFSSSFWWGLVNYPIVFFSIFLVIGLIVYWLTRDFIDWRVLFDDYLISDYVIIGIGTSLLITGIIFWIRYLLRKRKQKQKKSD